MGLCPQDVPPSDCPARYSSCSSLDSAADEPEDGGFLRLDTCALEESWFITPPPCFTAGGRAPVLLETSPLENLLIEHPSMSVYAVHAPRRACRSLDQPLLRYGRAAASSSRLRSRPVAWLAEGRGGKCQTSFPV